MNEHGLEAIVGLDRMTIHQCQELAKKIGFDSTEFFLVGPKGKKKAKWIDAYFGFLKIEDQDGFIMVSQLNFIQDLYCEGLKFVEKNKEKRND